jgi:hypothetical protein
MVSPPAVSRQAISRKKAPASIACNTIDGEAKTQPHPIHPRTLLWHFESPANGCGMGFHSAYFLCREVMGCQFPNPKDAQDFRAVGIENRHGQRAGYAGLTGVWFGHAAEVMLKVAEHDRLASLGRHSRDSLADGDPGDFFDKALGHSDLAHKSEMRPARIHLMDRAGLAVVLVEDDCQK